MSPKLLSDTQYGKPWSEISLDFTPTADNATNKTLPDSYSAAIRSSPPKGVHIHDRSHRLTDSFLCQFGDPLREELLLVRCRQCLKPLLPQCFAEHSERCLFVRNASGPAQLPSPRLALNTAAAAAARPSTAGNRPESGSKAVDTLLFSAQSPTAEILDDGELSMEEYLPMDEVVLSAGPSMAHRSVFRGLTLKRKRTGDVDFDNQCAVITVSGVPCTRPITCQVHSMLAKSLVQGRSGSFDTLLLRYQQRLESKYYFGTPARIEIYYDNSIVEGGLDVESNAINQQLAREDVADSTGKQLLQEQQRNYQLTAEDFDPEIDAIVEKIMRNPPRPLAVTDYRGTKRQMNLFRIKDFLLAVFNVQRQQQQQRVQSNPSAAPTHIGRPPSKQSSVGQQQAAAATAKKPRKKLEQRQQQQQQQQQQQSRSMAPTTPSFSNQPPPPPPTHPTAAALIPTQQPSSTTANTIDPRDLKFL